MEELREMKKAGKGAAARFSAKDEGEATVVEVCVSEMKGERTFREDMLDRVRDDRVV